MNTATPPGKAEASPYKRRIVVNTSELRD